MGFIKMLLAFLLIVIIGIFALVNNDFATFRLWPFDIALEVSLSVAIVFFIVFGFIWGKIFSWISYAPVRKALRKQKKQNKKLNKEQERLVKEMEGLHSNIATLKELEAKQPKKPGFKDRLRNVFKRKPKDTAAPTIESKE